MAGYRRFIAYVYDYESGKKGSNCGFIKVEVKDQQCSVEIHLHCPGLPENVKCNIYGFTRKDGLINGILLDTCETEKETVECLIITDATDMNDSGVAMGKLGGMIITSDTGGFFGTEWDDQPIRPENFHEIKAMPDADIPESAKITSQKPEVPADMVLQEMPEELEDISEKPEDTSLTKVPDDSLSIEPSANIPAQRTSDNKPGTESSYISDNTVEDSNSSENAGNPVPERNAENRKTSAEFSPFSDGELISAWKIHLDDLKHFPRHYCALRNNRFLQYGHYNFGYLLLGQRNNGQYILGVPGVYNQQERFMANMFGFPYFKESSYIEIPKMRGGYWYRLIIFFRSCQPPSDFFKILLRMQFPYYCCSEFIVQIPMQQKICCLKNTVHIRLFYSGQISIVIRTGFDIHSYFIDQSGFCQMFYNLRT